MAQKLEVKLNSWVTRHLPKEKGVEIWAEQHVPKPWQEALKGGSKTGNGTARVDHAITYQDLPNFAVIIEDKWGLNYLEKVKNNKLDTTKKCISQYAVNGALFYARKLISSGVLKDAFIVGLAAEDELSGEMKVNGKIYYVFSATDEPKLINDSWTNWEMFSQEEMKQAKQDAQLTDQEKARYLANSLKALKKSAQELNKLMYSHSISTEQRVTYVSGLLLSMQEIPGNKSLTPDDLIGNQSDKMRDSMKIYNAIEAFLENRVDNDRLSEDKKKMMLSVFSVLTSDKDRDVVDVPGNYSINKEIFTYIYENVFKVIDAKGHIDTLGEMYSEFLKYATGDGKDNGIVLTPPYVTKLMCELIDVNKESKILDPATGSAGFLVAAMDHMIDDVLADQSLTNEEKEEKIYEIKHNQLLGIEKDLKMYALATTNMILRGDGSSNIQKADVFTISDEILKQFQADRGLANPPFSYTENGMPFAIKAMDNMKRDGLFALIIQDSAGSGKAPKSNQEILNKHTLLASIKMPGDLFAPSAGVQTSIYVFKVGTPHDFKQDVKFIDFSNDGYKRTGRGLNEVDQPHERYRAVLDVYKYGKTNDEFEIDCIQEPIEGVNDWNYNQHQKIDTTVTRQDFVDTVGEYLMWQLSQELSDNK